MMDEVRCKSLRLRSFGLGCLGLGECFRPIAVDSLYLVVLGRERAVAQHDTVHAESMQVGFVAEVAAIEHLFYHFASYFFLHDDSLVYPVPDEAAQHARVRVDFVPILLKVAEGITH